MKFEAEIQYWLAAIGMLLSKRPYYQRNHVPQCPQVDTAHSPTTQHDIHHPRRDASAPRQLERKSIALHAATLDIAPLMH